VWHVLNRVIFVSSILTFRIRQSYKILSFFWNGYNKYYNDDDKCQLARCASDSLTSVSHDGDRRHHEVKTYKEIKTYDKFVLSHNIVAVDSVAIVQS